MQFFSILIAASVAVPILAKPFAAQEPPAPTEGPTRSDYMRLEQRVPPICIIDDLFELLLDKSHKSSASAFCSSYIAKTTSITSSTTSTVLTSTTTSAVLATDTTTFLTTITATVHTDTITSTDTIYAKRAAPATISIPGVLGIWATSLVSSACSCLVQPSTVTVKVITTGKPVTSTAIATIPLTTTTSTTATQTQTTDIPNQATATQTLPFCSYQTLVAKSDHAIFDVDCGTSYDNLPGGYYRTVDIADDCFNICDADETCGFFTFESGVPTNNCYLATVVNSNNGVLDANARSGYFTGAFAS